MRPELTQLPVVFIVGRGRSGSTLLQSILDAHPHVKIPPESRFVQFLYYKYHKRKNWTVKNSQAIIQDLKNSFEPPDILEDMLVADFKKHASDLTLSSICKLIYLNSVTDFQKEEIRLLGDKNPRYSFFIPQLIKIFPEAKFVHLIRDYRDNIAAIKRAGKNIGESGFLYFSIARWKLYNRIILKNQIRYPDRFFTLRYEDLISNPREEVQKLCGFLSIDFYPEMLEYHQGLEKKFGDEKFKVLHSSLKIPFNTSKIGEWEKTLSATKVKHCEVLVGSLPEQYKYYPKFRVNGINKFILKFCLSPIYFVGQLRFIFKQILFGMPNIMKQVYTVLQKFK